MEYRIIAGASGTGKTKFIIDLIYDKLNKNQKSIILLPSTRIKDFKSYAEYLNYDSSKLGTENTQLYDCTTVYPFNIKYIFDNIKEYNKKGIQNLFIDEMNCIISENYVYMWERLRKRCKYYKISLYATNSLRVYLNIDKKPTLIPSRGLKYNSDMIILGGIDYE